MYACNQVFTLTFKVYCVSYLSLTWALVWPWHPFSVCLTCPRHLFWSDLDITVYCVSYLSLTWVLVSNLDPTDYFLSYLLCFLLSHWFLLHRSSIPRSCPRCCSLPWMWGTGVALDAWSLLYVSKVTKELGNMGLLQIQDKKIFIPWQIMNCFRTIEKLNLKFFLGRAAQLHAHYQKYLLRIWIYMEKNQVQHMLQQVIKIQYNIASF